MFDDVTCCKCKVVKKRLSLGNYRYIDENGEHWRNRSCPSCSQKYLKEYRKVNNLFERKEALCDICKVLFLQRNANQRYCSKTCRKIGLVEYYRKKNGSVPKVYRTEKDVSCKFCSKTFKSNLSPKFCSRECFLHYKASIPKKVHKKKYPVNKQCLSCSSVYTATCSKNKYCPPCSIKAHKSRKKAANKAGKVKKVQRIPKWANLKEIELIYARCPEGHDVDHIIPLNGKNVCGLHVEYNLQYLSKEDNNLKRNSFDGTYDNNEWKNRR